MLNREWQQLAVAQPLFLLPSLPSCISPAFLILDSVSLVTHFSLLFVLSPLLFFLSTALFCPPPPPFPCAQHISSTHLPSLALLALLILPALSLLTLFSGPCLCSLFPLFFSLSFSPFPLPVLTCSCFSRLSHCSILPRSCVYMTASCVFASVNACCTCA